MLFLAPAKSNLAVLCLDVLLLRPAMQRHHVSRDAPVGRSGDLFLTVIFRVEIGRIGFRQHEFK